MKNSGDKKVSFKELNRAHRRRMAKNAKLFKDKTGGAWRDANKSMKKGGKKLNEHSH